MITSVLLAIFGAILGIVSLKAHQRAQLQEARLAEADRRFYQRQAEIEQERRAAFAQEQARKEQQAQATYMRRLESPDFVAQEIKRHSVAFDAPVFRDLAQHVRFTRQQVLVGTHKTGERFLGVESVESTTPADSIDIRPMRDVSELPMALASEWAMDEDILDIRMAQGEMLIQVPQENIPLMEDVFSPIYKDVVHTVYVLLDISPSMFPSNNPWREPVWKGLSLKVLFQSVQAGASFTLRLFSGQPHAKHHVVTSAQAVLLANQLVSIQEGNGTNIQAALLAAMKDVEGLAYDTADILIITDGEDNGNVDSFGLLRTALDERHIRLHAVMLGQQNEALRSCCDSYQIVEPNDKGVLVAGPLVTRVVQAVGSTV